MARFKRLRNLYQLVSNPKRYHRDQEIDLDESISVDEWRDEAKPTLGERLASRRRLFGAFALLGFLALGLVAAYSQRFLPSLYGNPYVIEAMKWAVVVPIIFILGMKTVRGKLKNIDWLVLFIPKKGARLYVGQKAEDTAGNRTFEPVKGFDILGLKGAPLTLGDLGDDFARNFAKAGRDPSSQATLRVEDSLHSSVDTFLGSVTCALTGGLELDEYGRESDLYTTPPDVADNETYKKLTTTLEQMRDKNSELKDRIDGIKEDRDEWKDMALKKREEIKQEMVDTHGELAEAGFAPRPQPVERGGSDIMDDELDN